MRVEGPRGRPLGFALYSSRSEIRLRMVGRGETLAGGFLRDRLAAAIRWRETVAAGASAYRVVHGEGDGLPALVVDRYGDYLVIQTLSQGMDRRKGEIVEALAELLQPRGILERNDPQVRQLEGLESRVGLLSRRGARAGRGRGERRRLPGRPLPRPEDGPLPRPAREPRGRPDVRSWPRPRRLHLHGGFALQVASVASEVLAVDVSGEALERLKANAERNGLTNVQVRDANVFDLLHDLDGRGERFDTVILDPPAFAKSKDAVEKARRGYKEINLRALRLLQSRRLPGHVLVLVPRARGRPSRRSWPTPRST